jgi:uncharacterized Rmd1/YagE family protein
LTLLALAFRLQTVEWHLLNSLLVDRMNQTQTMASSANEQTPLLSDPPPKPKISRTVTFNANPVSKTIEPEPEPPRPRSSHHHHKVPTSPGGSTAIGIAGPPMLTALGGKLRRRNSHGAVPSSLPSPATAASKIGPQRSTKNAQKLKLLPNPEIGDDGPDEESGRDVYSQYTRIKDPTARRDAARLGKADRDRLPRVTAYCTANTYQIDALMRFMKGRGKLKGANPKLIDECIYTPYSYDKSVEEQYRRNYGTRSHGRHSFERRHSTGDVSIDEFSPLAAKTLNSERYDSGYADGFSLDGNGLSSQDLLGPGIGDDSAIDDNPDFDVTIHTPEIFLFAYGVVVIWGMSLAHEQRFLKEMSKFETEKLAPDDVETEYFNFYYTREYQARIYNDFITLRDKNNYMTKLAISHALAQSVKVSTPKNILDAAVAGSLSDETADISFRGTYRVDDRDL